MVLTLPPGFSPGATDRFDRNVFTGLLWCAWGPTTRACSASSHLRVSKASPCFGARGKVETDASSQAEGAARPCAPTRERLKSPVGAAGLGDGYKSGEVG